MKRVGNLYEKICDIENLRLAHKNASSQKGWYEEVKMVNEDLDYYLNEIRKSLINKTFTTSAYQVFTKKEGKKIRTIYKLPYYPDRIVQWAIIQVIEPYLIRTFTNDTYSSIPKRGIHKALGKLQKQLYTKPEECTECLKLDIRHFYQSINHDILKTRYRRIIKDNDLLYLLDDIVDSICTVDIGDAALLCGDEELDVGVPIGNYMSQYFGNLYLSTFDHWIKENNWVKGYYRYMDDIVILSDDSELLHYLLEDIKEYLWNNLRLVLNNHYQIFHTFERGIDFVGYRIFSGYTLLRKTTCKNFKRKMVKIYTKYQNGITINNSDYCCFNAYNGWLKWCDSFRLKKKYCRLIDSAIEFYYEYIIKMKVGEFA